MRRLLVAALVMALGLSFGMIARGQSKNAFKDELIVDLRKSSEVVRPQKSPPQRRDLVDQVEEARLDVQVLEADAEMLRKRIHNSRAKRIILATGDIPGDDTGFITGEPRAEQVKHADDAVASFRTNYLDYLKELRTARRRLTELEQRLEQGQPRATSGAAARAQVQSRDRKGQPAKDRAKLRARVVRLRTELELLQLEHDAARTSIYEVLKNLRQAEIATAMGQLKTYYDFSDEKAAKAIEEAVANGQNADEAKKQMVEAAKRKEVEATRALIERRKQQFARQAAELSEKRLELDEAESRYHEAN